MMREKVVDEPLVREAAREASIFFGKDLPRNVFVKRCQIISMQMESSLLFLFQEWPCEIVQHAPESCVVQNVDSLESHWISILQSHHQGLIKEVGVKKEISQRGCQRIA